MSAKMAEQGTPKVPSLKAVRNLVKKKILRTKFFRFLQINQSFAAIEECLFKKKTVES